MKKKPTPIPFHRASLGKAELAQAAEAIKSGWITMGPKTLEFETEFKAYLAKRGGLKPETLHAVSANSATAALHLALKAIGLKRGDEVIIPTTTFIATAEVVTYFGAVPVLCDVEEDTHNIDASRIERLVTRRTKAIIPVHFAGQPCDMDEIMAIARRRRLKVIEDAAHSLPSDYKCRPVGTIGDITCFSFYATKTLAAGEGGMLVTANEAYAKHARINRLHGISRDAWDRYTLKGSWRYEVVDNGYKYNTTDINSGLGLAQLRRLDAMNAARLRIAARYDRAFAGSAVVRPVVRPDRTTCAHLYVIKVAGRDELYDKLKADGIGTSVHFIPVHKHPYYRKAFGYRNADYPVANRVFERSLSLPIYPDMTDAQVRRVAEGVLAHAR
ncbi:MAG: DegT/DnrJ/EryC1/StrS family aminotransferase [Elusimicrobiota bacterium]|nr:MAG: DegT/DnrJ/EryC1/StrS family aminotransferase [Elusimicrobiota bacterium]